MLLKKIYLDVCVLCRPFDNQNYMRVRLETNAFYQIAEALRLKRYQMLSSPVHFEEVSEIKDLSEKNEVLSFLNQYGKKIQKNYKNIRERAEKLYEMGMGLADAAHVAFAEAEASVFISCDDRLLKKVDKILALNPVMFCEQEKLR